MILFRTDFGWTGVERVENGIKWLRKNNLLRGKLNPQQLAEATRSKINNSALLLVARDTLFSQFVLDELRLLSHKKEALLQQGMLATLFALSKPQRINTEAEYGLISKVNLNQQVAVNKGLDLDFSVVTGAPGTGKSQVVLNAAVAAILKGQTVIVASKNNADKIVSGSHEIFQQLPEVVEIC